MTKELVKRFIKKDGSQRISFYREEYADNPRYNTDEPLHCEDWSRDYTIMSKEERSTESANASTLLRVFIRDYGDHNKILDLLFDNGKHMHDGKSNGGDALVYDRKYKIWKLYSYMHHYNHQTRDSELGWYEILTLPCKKSEIYIDGEIIDALEDDTIDYIVEHCMTDGVKLGSYSFGYDGDITFSDGADTNSEGICWLEKDEFLKYAGGDNSEWIKKEEQVWKEKTLDEIEFLIEELKAWADNDVYGYIVEDCIKSKIHKEYTNVDKDDEDYEEEEWEESDSCWGFYGDIDKVTPYMFDNTGLKQEDFEEEDV